MVFNISSRGFAFLLKDVHVQIWSIVLEYLHTAPQRRQSVADIVAFLFQLSYCRVGGGYSVKCLSPSQRAALLDFSNFGLIYLRRPNAHKFFATQLAVSLIFGATQSLPSGSEGGEGEGAGSAAPGTAAAAAGGGGGGGSGLIASADTSWFQVFVQTNFQVVAYTSSVLHLAMLETFCDLKIKLPNMCLGQLSRRSVQAALGCGVTAQQIYCFLLQRAHPRMRTNSPVIPENVTDQLFLWQRERVRMVSTPSTVLDEFESEQQYEMVKRFAQSRDGLLWSQDATGMLAIKPDLVRGVRDLIHSNPRA